MTVCFGIIYLYRSVVIKAFKSADYQEAMVYYTRSIQFKPSAAAYNNRALIGECMTCSNRMYFLICRYLYMYVCIYVL